MPALTQLPLNEDQPPFGDRSLAFRPADRMLRVMNDQSSSRYLAVGLAPMSLGVLVLSVALAWHTQRFWGSGAGFAMPSAAGVLAAGAVWLASRDWRRGLLSVSAGVAITGVGVVAVVACTLMRWEG